MLVLAALALLVGMAIAGAASASATVLCKTNTSPCSEKYPAGTEIKAWMSGTNTLATTEGTTLDTCSGGDLAGPTKTAGSATETVGGPVSALTWTSCTEPTVTISLGQTETHWSSGSNGLYTSGGGTQVTVNTTVVGSCVFTIPSGSTIGTVTGGATATVDINAAVTRVSGLCPSTVKWVGTFQVTSPSPLYIEPS